MDDAAAQQQLAAYEAALLDAAAADTSVNDSAAALLLLNSSAATTASGGGSTTATVALLPPTAAVAAAAPPPPAASHSPPAPASASTAAGGRPALLAGDASPTRRASHDGVGAVSTSDAYSDSDDDDEASGPGSSGGVRSSGRGSGSGRSGSGWGGGGGAHNAAAATGIASDADFDGGGSGALGSVLADLELEDAAGEAPVPIPPAAATTTVTPAAALPAPSPHTDEALADEVAELREAEDEAAAASTTAVAAVVSWVREHASSGPAAAAIPVPPSVARVASLTAPHPRSPPLLPARGGTPATGPITVAAGPCPHAWSEAAAPAMLSAFMALPSLTLTPPPLPPAVWYPSMAALVNATLAGHEAHADAAGAAKLMQDMARNTRMAKRRILLESQLCAAMLAAISRAQPGAGASVTSPSGGGGGGGGGGSGSNGALAAQSHSHSHVHAPVPPSSPTAMRTTPLPPPAARSILAKLVPTPAVEEDPTAAVADAAFQRAAEGCAARKPWEVPPLVRQYLFHTLRLHSVTQGTSAATLAPSAAAAAGAFATAVASWRALGDTGCAAPEEPALDVVRSTLRLAGNHSNGAKMSVLADVFRALYRLSDPTDAGGVVAAALAAAGGPHRSGYDSSGRRRTLEAPQSSPTGGGGGGGGGGSSSSVVGGDASSVSGSMRGGAGSGSGGGGFPAHSTLASGGSRAPVASTMGASMGVAASPAGGGTPAGAPRGSYRMHSRPADATSELTRSPSATGSAMTVSHVYASRGYAVRVQHTVTPAAQQPPVRRNGRGYSFVPSSSAAAGGAAAAAAAAAAAGHPGSAATPVDARRSSTPAAAALSVVSAPAPPGEASPVAPRPTVLPHTHRASSVSGMTDTMDDGASGMYSATGLDTSACGRSIAASTISAGSTLDRLGWAEFGVVADGSGGGGGGGGAATAASSTITGTGGGGGGEGIGGTGTGTGGGDERKGGGGTAAEFLRRARRGAVPKAMLAAALEDFRNFSILFTRGLLAKYTTLNTLPGLLRVRAPPSTADIHHVSDFVAFEKAVQADGLVVLRHAVVTGGGKDGTELRKSTPADSSSAVATPPGRSPATPAASGFARLFSFGRKAVPTPPPPPPPAPAPLPASAGGGGGAGSVTSGGGGGGSGGRPILTVQLTLDCAPLVLRTVQEALHTLVYDTLLDLFSVQHDAADEAWADACATLRGVPPCVYGMPHVYCSGNEAGCTAATPGAAGGVLADPSIAPTAAGRAAAVYAPAVALLREVSRQRTPLAKTAALRAAMTTINLAAGVERDILARAATCPTCTGFGVSSTSLGRVSLGDAAIGGGGAGGGSGGGGTGSGWASRRSSGSSWGSSGSIGGGSLTAALTSALAEAGSSPVLAGVRGSRTGSTGAAASTSSSVLAGGDDTPNRASPPLLSSRMRSRGRSGTQVVALGADDLMPRLCFILAVVASASLPTELEYCDACLPEDRRNGEDGYAVVSMHGAVMHVRQLAEAHRSATAAAAAGTTDTDGGADVHGAPLDLSGVSSVSVP